VALPLEPDVAVVVAVVGAVVEAVVGVVALVVAVATAVVAVPTLVGAAVLVVAVAALIVVGGAVAAVLGGIVPAEDDSATIEPVPESPSREYTVVGVAGADATVVNPESAAALLASVVVLESLPQPASAKVAPAARTTRRRSVVMESPGKMWWAAWKVELTDIYERARPKDCAGGTNLEAKDCLTCRNPFWSLVRSVG
jgi:hypothetical protein